MHPGNSHLGDNGSTHWPDFYSILNTAPDIDIQSLRRSINDLYVKANEQSDHRDLSTRFYNQVLSQKVLPQCRRILLNEEARQAYDKQWYLHRDSAEGALSYQEFIREIAKDAGTARALLLSDDEISLLPGFGSAPAFAPLAPKAQPQAVPSVVLDQGATSEALIDEALPAAPGEVTADEVIEGEAVLEAEEVVAPASPPVASNAVIVASPAASFNARKKSSPLLPIVAGLVVLGIAGAAWKMTSQSKKLPESAPTTATAPKDEATVSNSRVPVLDTPLLSLNTLALNADFETGVTGPWQSSSKFAYVETPPNRKAKSGNKILTFYSGVGPLNADVKQVVKGLQPGKYTFRAWTRRSGGQPVADMFVQPAGGALRKVAFPSAKEWVLLSIRDIDVKNGECTIGFLTESPAMKYIKVDAVEFFRQ